MRVKSTQPLRYLLALAAIAGPSAGAWGQSPREGDPDRPLATFVQTPARQGSRGHDAKGETMGVAQTIPGPGGGLADSRFGLVFSGELDSPNGSGLTLATVDDATRSHLKLPKDQGVLVTSAIVHAPAWEAGVRENDILLTLGDKPIGKPEDLDERLKAAADDGGPQELVVLRGGKPVTIKVQPLVQVMIGPVRPEPPALAIGVALAPLERALRLQLELPEAEGLLVSEVVADGPAARAGVQPNDILLKFASEPIRDQESLVDRIQKHGEAPATLEILREGQRRTVELTPERRRVAYATSREIPIQRRIPFTFQAVPRPGVVIGRHDPLRQGAPPNVRVIPGVTVPPGLGIRIGEPPPPAPAQDPALSKRLDDMSAQIEALRKTVQQLSDELRAKNQENEEK
jgi:membrane-associated protease RseP (regulator of RpoE activity)